MKALSSLLLMAGGPAHILPGAAVPIGPWHASKTKMKILCSLPKFTSRIRLQSPRENRLFAPKTQQAVWVRPLQTKIMCKPLLDGTNSGSSALEGLIKFTVVAVKAVFKIFVEGKYRVVFEEVVLFLRRLFVDFKLIKEELEGMQRLLDDAESELITVAGNEDIRDQVSFEIRDVIDDFDDRSETTQRTRLEVVRRVQRFFMSQQLMIRCVQRFFSQQLMIWCVQRFFSLQLMTRFWVNCQILEKRLKIRDIFKKREFSGILREINERRREERSSIQSLQDRRRYSAENEEPEEVVGLQEEIKTVKERLINGEQSRCVISIVGIPGSGKTTLARKVYELDDVKNHFERRAFISLSQQYEIKDVLMRIIKAVRGLSRAETEKMNEEELRGMLRDHLTKKKYLVVIDDVWSKDAWNMLKPALPDAQNKSRVMFTTRKEDVALPDDQSSHTVQMRLLNPSEGWKLFMKKIFPKEKNPSTACPSDQMEKIGREILAKCGGLPLAIVVLGGVLQNKRTPREWSNVLEIVNYHLTKGSDCMEILALSYWDLPYYLKPCFLYVGLFPEDYEIDSAKLIQLWIAEGFIQQRRYKMIEDDAEEYLKELIQRNMIQASWKRHDGSVGGCRIHDLFREFTILKAGKNNFFTIHNVEGTHSLPNNIRRLALHRSIDGYLPPKNLRSILNFNFGFGLSQVNFRQAKLLRVVSETLNPSAAFTTVVGEFVRLRYLELGASESLPSSIGDLNNLRTLVLHRPNGPLPDAIANLKQLTHLNAVCDYEREGNLAINNLTNLQTLCLKAGSWIEDGFGKLNNLRKLQIYGDISSYHKTLFNSIEKFKNLQSLSLQSGRYFPLSMSFANHLNIYEMSLYGRLKKLPELPPNLTELTLYFSDLEQDAISILENLPHLKILRLGRGAYFPRKMTCSSGGFPRLEFLELDGLPLEEWIVEEGAMPYLKSVKLMLMYNLKPEALPEPVRVCLNRISQTKGRSGA